MKRDAFSKAENHLNRALEALGLPLKPAGDPVESMPRALRLGGLQAVAAVRTGNKEGGERALREQLISLYQVRDNLRACQVIMEHEQETRRQPVGGDPALDRLLTELGVVWMDFFKRRVGTSTTKDSRRATGPFIRFVEQSLRPLLKDKTPTRPALRDRIRKIYLDKR